MPDNAPLIPGSPLDVARDRMIDRIQADANVSPAFRAVLRPAKPVHIYRTRPPARNNSEPGILAPSES